MLSCSLSVRTTPAGVGQLIGTFGSLKMDEACVSIDGLSF